MPLVTLLPTLQIHTDSLAAVYVSHADNKLYVFYKASTHAKEVDCRRHGGADTVAKAVSEKLFKPVGVDTAPFTEIKTKKKLV